MGLTLFWSPGPFKLQVPSLLRLWPLELIFWSQFPPVLSATIVFCSVDVPPAFVTPAPNSPVFSAIVLLLTLKVPSFPIPPPHADAVFPARVLLMTVAVPEFQSPPPKPAPKGPLTVLPERVLLVIVTVPALPIPAPIPAKPPPLPILLLILELLTVSVPALEMPPPKKERPLRIVKPEIATFALVLAIATTRPKSTAVNDGSGGAGTHDSQAAGYGEILVVCRSGDDDRITGRSERDGMFNGLAGCGGKSAVIIITTRHPVHEKVHLAYFSCLSCFRQVPRLANPEEQSRVPFRVVRIARTRRLALLFPITAPVARSWRGWSRDIRFMIAHSPLGHRFMLASGLDFRHRAFRWRG